jgi:hypothetical protein
VKRFALLTTLFAIATLSIGGLVLRRWTPGSIATVPAALSPATGTVRQSAQLRRQRPVYPYSVVPGGVYAAAEVRTAVLRLPAVAQHYAPVALGQLRPVVLAQARAAYVSYRRGNRIYWTARPVQLRAGETVLSDGKEQIRARCGNRISATPQQPVEQAGTAPLVAELDQPIVVTTEAQPEPTPEITLTTQTPAETVSTIDNELVPAVAANQVVATAARLTGGSEGGTFFPPLQIPFGGLPLGTFTPRPLPVTQPAPGTTPPAEPPTTLLPPLVIPPVVVPTVPPTVVFPPPVVTVPEEPQPGNPENPPPPVTSILPRLPDQPTPERPNVPPPPVIPRTPDNPELPPVTPVPEPATWMLCLGASGAAFVWKKRAQLLGAAGAPGQSPSRRP